MYISITSFLTENMSSFCFLRVLQPSDPPQPPPPPPPFNPQFPSRVRSTVGD